MTIIFVLGSVYAVTARVASGEFASTAVLPPNVLIASHQAPTTKAQEYDPASHGSVVDATLTGIESVNASRWISPDYAITAVGSDDSSHHDSNETSSHGSHADSHADTHGESSHTYYGIWFACVSGLIGISVSLFLHSFAPSVPYTPTLLVIGILLAALDRYWPYMHNSTQFHNSMQARPTPNHTRADLVSECRL